jgi:hypothetical protein
MVVSRSEALKEKSMEAPKAGVTGENLLLGTWKLQSMIYESIATGQRSSPFGDHPDGYLSYSADGGMYAIGLQTIVQIPATWFQRTRRKQNFKEACSPMQERILQTVKR